jgi:hypothetical protein
LGDISNRLESFYSDRFGAANVVIIKDSRVVEKGSLDPDKAFIQVRAVFDGRSRGSSMVSLRPAIPYYSTLGQPPAGLTTARELAT